MPSIEELEKLVQQFPDKPFPRYGLAMEYKKVSRLDDAVPHFREAMKLDPNYVAAWFQCGIAYQEAGKVDDARRTYEEGIAVAQRVGNGHALSELRDALASLG